MKAKFEVEVNVRNEQKNTDQGGMNHEMRQEDKVYGKGSMSFGQLTPFPLAKCGHMRK